MCVLAKDVFCVDFLSFEGFASVAAKEILVQSFNLNVLQCPFLERILLVSLKMVLFLVLSCSPA